MFDVHYIKMRPSWLMYYLGRIYEDEFISMAVKLGYPMKQKNESYNKCCNVVGIKYFQKISKKCIEIFIRFILYKIGSFRIFY